MAKRPTARAKASKAASSTTTTTTAAATSTASALGNLKSDYLAASARFGNTKKYKRLIRHGNLLAKVRQGGINKPSASLTARKVRRPSKKLKTSVQDLGDALPDVDMDDGESVADEAGGGGGGERSGAYAEDEWEGVSDDGGDEKTEGVEVKTAGTRRRRSQKEADGHKMIMKSLAHRQGSMKRKKVLEEKEMERFKRNLAQLASAQTQTQTAGEVKGVEGNENTIHHQKWTALRAFIGTTMEKDQAFEGK